MATTEPQRGSFWTYKTALLHGIDFWDMMQKWYISPSGGVIGALAQRKMHETDINDINAFELLEIDIKHARLAVGSPEVVAKLVYSACKMRKEF